MRIWRKEILEVSPNGTLIRMEGREGEDDIWMKLGDIEILDNQPAPPPRTPYYATQKKDSSGIPAADTKDSGSDF